MTYRCRANHLTTGGFEFAHAGRVERMNRGDRSAIECGIQFAPFARGHYRTRGQTHGLKHHADGDGIRREHFTNQCDGGFVAFAIARRCDRTGAGFIARITQHGTGEYVLGFGVRRHTKSRHVDADDAHTIDFFGQDLQWHTTGCWYTQIDDDDGVIQIRIGFFMDRVANVFEQLACHEGFRIKRHIAHASACAIKMRSEGQSINAASRARENGRRTTHAQANTQGTKRRAHALRLIMRAFWIVLCILIQRFTFACSARSGIQLIFAGMAAETIRLEGFRVGNNRNHRMAHGACP